VCEPKIVCNLLIICVILGDTFIKVFVYSILQGENMRICSECLGWVPEGDKYNVPKEKPVCIRCTTLEIGKGVSW